MSDGSILGAAPFVLVGSLILHPIRTLKWVLSRLAPRRKTP